MNRKPALGWPLHVGTGSFTASGKPLHTVPFYLHHDPSWPLEKVDIACQHTGRTYSSSGIHVEFYLIVHMRIESRFVMGGVAELAQEQET